jgi:hypothetical protein
MVEAVSGFFEPPSSIHPGTDNLKQILSGSELDSGTDPDPPALKKLPIPMARRRQTAV